MEPIDNANTIDPSNYVDRLKQHMSQLSPTPTRTPTRTAIHLPKDLKTCTHVYKRCDAVRKPLQPPYDRPYRVLSRRDKFYTVSVNGKKENVSIDRLKVAYQNDTPDATNATTDNFHSPTPLPLTDRDTTTTSTRPPYPEMSTTPALRSAPTPSAPITKTRSGRHVHWPKRYVQIINTG